jgi:hypothetical protein
VLIIEIHDPSHELVTNPIKNKNKKKSSTKNN